MPESTIRAMTGSFYAGVVATLLALSGFCHIFWPTQTKHWMSKPVLVRFVGGCLLLLSVPCLWWRGWYFWTLFGPLVASGAWRLGFPRHSIRAQEASYPRWVHGCLLLAAAMGVRMLRP